MNDELKKFAKRITLSQNKMKGKNAEAMFEVSQRIIGNKVERKGHAHGSDYKVTKRQYNILTGKWDCGKAELVEIKTGNAKLSPLQEKTKKKMKGKYKVWRA